MESRFYTVEEVAERLRMHVKTVQRLCREGKFKFERYGRRWLILKDQFEEKRHP